MSCHKLASNFRHDRAKDEFEVGGYMASPMMWVFYCSDSCTSLAVRKKRCMEAETQNESQSEPPVRKSNEAVFLFAVWNNMLP